MASVIVQVPGLPGPPGPPGITGDPGPENTLSIGTVTSLAAGASPTATLTGTSPAQTLSLGIPAGATGPANSLSIGTVTTLAAGANATATITGTAPNQTLSLGIPQGAVGAGAPDATASAKGSVQLAGDFGGTAAAPTVTGGTHHTHTSTQISDAASAATASKVVIRDAAGRAQVVDPSVAADIATKNYVDAQTKSTNRLLRNTQTVTTYTLALTDEQLAVEFSSPGAVTVTVPSNATVAFATGAWLEIASSNTNMVTLSPAAGVTLRAPDGSIVTRAQFSRMRLHYIGSDVWVVGGDTNNAVAQAVSAAVSASTANTLIKRDANGRASVVDPSASTDIATKNYVDARALSTRLITAGTGLTGGGDLTADRTLAVAYGTTAGTATQGNDARVTADQAAATASIRTIGTGALQAAAGNHTHTATGISDSTTVGRAVLTAADAPTARTAIGAGTSSLVIGTTSTTAKAGDYQPTAANISDSTSVGRSLITAADAAAARTATGAAFGNGITEVRLITQAAYTALGTYSSSTLYVIQG